MTVINFAAARTAQVDSTRAERKAALARRRGDLVIERARFIIQAASEANLSVAILGSSVSVWAPLAKSPEAQAACQESFETAIQASIGAIRIVAHERRRRRRRSEH
jgi:hypothetical protein